MKPIKTGLLGLGTVGGGVVTVLTRNAHEIARRAGREVVISHAAAKEYDADTIEGLDQDRADHRRRLSPSVDDPEVEISHRTDRRLLPGEGNGPAAPLITANTL